MSQTSSNPQGQRAPAGKKRRLWQSNALLIAIVGVFLVFSILQTLWIYQKVNSIGTHELTTLASTSIVSLCIKEPVTVNNDCGQIMYRHRKYECQENATNPYGTTGLWSNVFITSPWVFTITAGGYINLTPSDSDIGNHTTVLFYDDQSPCGPDVHNAIYNFSVLWINNPPYLTHAIPNVSFKQGEEIRPYFLSNYFTDPDNDPLDYFVSGNAHVDINISAQTEVRMRSPDFCGNEIVYFSVVEHNTTEMYGNTSNAVLVSVGCNQSSGVGTGKGGGGGAGGGSVRDCKPNWQCQAWSTCNLNNTREKLCYDMNGCDGSHYKNTVIERCPVNNETPCVPNWSCGQWGSCLFSQQQRLCIDMNACQTKEGKPNETMSCQLPPSCTNGIKDENETGVDCGGPCPACGIVEKPAVLGEAQGGIVFALVLLVFLLLILIVVARTYRKEIYAYLARMGLLGTALTPRTILLSRAQLEQMLMNLGNAQKRWPLLPQKKAGTEYTVLARLYLKTALDLPYEAEVEEVKTACVRKRLHKTPSRLFEVMMRIVMQIESEKWIPTKEAMQYLFWELRTILLITSEIGRAEYRIDKEPSDIVPDQEKTQAFEALRKINSSVRHLQVEKAQAEYLAALELYNNLPTAQKEIIYPHLVKTYCLIQLAESI